MAVHRATLKKKQKGFKSKHSSKSALKTANKGRIDREGNALPKKHVLSKSERKNLAKQIQTGKKAAAHERLKIFEGRQGCPRNVCFVPLTADIAPKAALNSFITAMEGQADKEISNVFTVPRFRQKLRLFFPEYQDFYGILDAARTADFIVYLLSASTEIDDYGESIIRCVSSQGSTTAMGMIYGMEDILETKDQQFVKQSLTVWFQHFFPETDKLAALANDQETMIVVRQICQKTPKGISYRDDRSYIVAEKIEAMNNQLAIQGIVRGQNLNVNSLLHIPEFGDLRVEKITIVAQEEVVLTPSESSLINELANPKTDAAEADAEMSDEDMSSMDEDEDDSDYDFNTAVGVRLDGHHYIDEAVQEEMGEGMQSIKAIPKGMSDYQASWLLEGEDYGLEEEEFEEADVLSDEEGELVTADAHGDASMDVEPSNEDPEHVELSAQEEAKQLKEFRRKAEDDLEFPDEVELQPQESGKNRLQRYRGLRDFRNCYWNPNEKDERKPEEYDDISRPGNLLSTKGFVLKRMAHADSSEIAEVGQKVVIIATFVSNQNSAKVQQLAQAIQTDGRAVGVYSMLPYEDKIGQINLSLTPDSEHTTPLKSKAPIVVQYGCRRVVVEPLYSQSGAQNDNNVYKFFRFLQPGRPATVSFTGPCMLGTAPVLYFTTNKQDPKLIGSGVTMDADSRRVIVKTAVLTGHPFKIHKKLVTVRYMFFNREDVKWFKAVPLFTRWGCTGYIKEALGTHGYFKATFDKKIKAQDTISMALYKREWPRRAIAFSEYES